MPVGRTMNAPRAKTVREDLQLLADRDDLALRKREFRCKIGQAQESLQRGESINWNAKRPRGLALFVTLPEFPAVTSSSVASQNAPTCAVPNLITGRRGGWNRHDDGPVAIEPAPATAPLNQTADV